MYVTCSLSLPHSQATVEREVGVLLQLKERLQKLTGKPLPSSASDKKKGKEKQKQQQEEVGAAGRKEPEKKQPKQQPKQTEAEKVEGDTHKKITR